jgi:hypothetical protein
MQLSECIKIAPEKVAGKNEFLNREWIFTYNHFSMFALEKLSGQSAWAVLVQSSESFTRLAQLAWVGSEEFRLNTRQESLTFDAFLKNGYLPGYLSDEWFVFQDAINDLVNRTFLKAARTRTELQILVAVQTMSNLANTAQLIGTSDSTAESDSSDSAPENSGTSGTG